MTISITNILKNNDIREFSEKETENAYIYIENLLKDPKPHPNQKQWNSFWGEHKLDDDRPNYLNDRVYYRLNGKFVEGPKTLEHDIFTEIKSQLFRKYAWRGGIALELGCGIGENLVQLKRLYPNWNCFGCDWSDNAVRICKEKEEIAGAFKFDLLNDTELPVKPNLVFTCGALEQLHSIYNLKYNLLPEIGSYNPNCIFIHIEPFVEMYDAKNPFDKIAIRYHHARRYFSEFLPYIDNDDYDNSFQVLHKQRIGFGNMFNEGYMILVWKYRI